MTDKERAVLHRFQSKLIEEIDSTAQPIGYKMKCVDTLIKLIDLDNGRTSHALKLVHNTVESMSIDFKKIKKLLMENLSTSKKS